MSYAYSPDSTLTDAINSLEERSIDYFVQGPSTTIGSLPMSPNPVSQMRSALPEASDTNNSICGSPNLSEHTLRSTKGTGSLQQAPRERSSTSRDTTELKEEDVFDYGSVKQLPLRREQHKCYKFENITNLQVDELDQCQRTMDQMYKMEVQSRSESKSLSIVSDKDDADDVMNREDSAHAVRSNERSPSIAITDPELLDLISTGGTTTTDVGIPEGGNGVLSTNTPQRVLSSPASDRAYFNGGLVTTSDRVRLSPIAPATPTPSEASTIQFKSSSKGANFSNLGTPVLDSLKNKHVSFDDKSSSALETQFIKTLNQLKQFRDKNNSSSKPRRKASLPEEIAELAKEANEAEDGSDLDKYRVEDIGPMDPVMEAEVAGDLILPTILNPQFTYVRQSVQKAPTVHTVSPAPHADSISPTALKDRAPPTPTSEEVILDTVSPGKLVKYELEVPGHYGEPNKLKVATAGSIAQIMDFIRVKAEELDATPQDIEIAVKKFYKYPGSFIVDGEIEPEDESSILEYVDNLVENEGEHPTFVKVIGMLPLAMISAVALPVARYTEQVANSVLQKVGWLSVDDQAEEQSMKNVKP